MYVRQKHREKTFRRCFRLNNSKVAVASFPESPAYTSAQDDFPVYGVGIREASSVLQFDMEYTGWNIPLSLRPPAACIRIRNVAFNSTKRRKRGSTSDIFCFVPLFAAAAPLWTRRSLARSLLYGTCARAPGKSFLRKDQLLPRRCVFPHRHTRTCNRVALLERKEACTSELIRLVSLERRIHRSRR